MPCNSLANKLFSAGWNIIDYIEFDELLMWGDNFTKGLEGAAKCTLIHFELPVFDELLQPVSKSFIELFHWRSIRLLLLTVQHCDVILCNKLTRVHRILFVQKGHFLIITFYYRPCD